jgi:hypothetical protein
MSRYFFHLTEGHSLSVADEAEKNSMAWRQRDCTLRQWPGNCRAADYHVPSLDVTSQ